MTAHRHAWQPGTTVNGGIGYRYQWSTCATCGKRRVETLNAGAQVVARRYVAKKGK